MVVLQAARTNQQREERRSHPRINVSTAVEVSGKHWQGPATLVDLSLGGACFTTPGPVGKLGETVLLSIPVTQNERIGLIAEIVRGNKTNAYHTAVRFSLVEPRLEEKLNALLELLIAAGDGGTRRHARVARRMHLRYGSSGQMSAMLGDISRGGLSMTVSRSFELQEMIVVVIADRWGADALTLKARVVNQAPLLRKGGGLGFRVGLKFEPIDPMARMALDLLLKQYLRAAAER
jgi:c-di-GMP-binding flagellar brake protein YcgR